MQNRSCSASDSAYSYTFLRSVVCLSVVCLSVRRIRAPCLNRTTNKQVHLWESNVLWHIVRWRFLTSSSSSSSSSYIRLMTVDIRNFYQRNHAKKQEKEDLEVEDDFMIYYTCQHRKATPSLRNFLGPCYYHCSAIISLQSARERVDDVTDLWVRVCSTWSPPAADSTIWWRHSDTAVFHTDW